MSQNVENEYLVFCFNKNNKEEVHTSFDDALNTLKRLLVINAQNGRGVSGYLIGKNPPEIIFTTEQIKESNSDVKCFKCMDSGKFKKIIPKNNQPRTLYGPITNYYEMSDEEIECNCKKKDNYERSE